ncbi:MAG: hypothetical protein AAF402_13170 [Pseudomonadota bacterium]
MNSTSDTEIRRNVLKTSVAAGTVLTAWQKPVINSIFLPAHAQTSVLESRSITVVNNEEANGGDPLDGVYVIFDGSSLQLIEFACCSPLPATNGDGIVVLDSERTIDNTDECNGPALDTLRDPSSLGDTNWSVTGPESNNLGDGTYVFTATRLTAPSVGAVFIFSVTVSLTATETHPINLDCNGFPLITETTMDVSVTVSPG